MLVDLLNVLIISMFTVHRQSSFIKSSFALTVTKFSDQRYNEHCVDLRLLLFSLAAASETARTWFDPENRHPTDTELTTVSEH